MDADQSSRQKVSLLFIQRTGRSKRSSSKRVFKPIVQQAQRAENSRSERTRSEVHNYSKRRKKRASKDFKFMVSTVILSVSFYRHMITCEKTSMGGSLTDRMRFLMEIYTGMRDVLGPDFSISVKLNASDFSSGGLSEDESHHVARLCLGAGIDLIEISGGNYENPRMFKEIEESSEDIFFMDYTEKLKVSVDVPVVVNGGFHSVNSMEEPLRQSKTSMRGLAHPLVLYPDLPDRIAKGKQQHIDTPQLTTGRSYLDRKVASLMGISYYEQQIARLSEGKEARIARNGWRPLLHTLKSHGLTGLFPKR